MNEIWAAFHLLSCPYFLFKISHSINNTPSFKEKLRTKLRRKNLAQPHS